MKIQIMNEESFIKKYRNKEFTLKFYGDKDISTFLVFVDSLALDRDEEEIFWTLLPYTDLIYEDKDTEILKLII